MDELRPEHVDASKKLFISICAAATIMGNELPAICSNLRLGSGFFRRKLSSQIMGQTNIEVWAYLSALMVSMVESWPKRPMLSDFKVIMGMIEGALFDAQKINCRSEYDIYRNRFKTGCSSLGFGDSKLSKFFGPMHGLHQEFIGRLSIAWQVPSPATISPYSQDPDFDKAGSTCSDFVTELSKLTKNIEAGFKKGLKDLWPT